MQESVHKNVVNKLLLELQECLNNSDTMECAKSVIKRYIKTYHPDKSGK